MSGENLWVWVGDPDDRLDVLRYVRATDVDVLRHPAARRTFDRMASDLAALRVFVRDVESECLKELAWLPCGEIQGFAPDDLRAQLWSRHARARLLLGNRAVCACDKDPGNNNGWDGPGWYFGDETGGLHGPFADRMEAEKALVVYATTLA